MNLPALTFERIAQTIPILLISLCMLMACRQPVQRNNEITEVEVETGACFGPCQLTAVSIDSSLAYRYYGGEVLSRTNRPEDKFKLEGNYIGKVSQQFWDTLNVKLEQIHYQQLASVYEGPVDGQSLEIIIHYKGKIKHISAQSASLPDSVANAFYWIAESYRKVKPKKTNSSMHFEITSLYPPLPPPTMPVHPRFPPPIMKE